MAVRAIACEAVAVRDIGVLLGTEKQDGLFGQQFQYIVVQYSGIKNFCTQKKYDVWHCLHQDSKFLPLNSHSKLILTVHDLNFLSEHHLNDEKFVRAWGDCNVKLIERILLSPFRITLKSTRRKFKR